MKTISILGVFVFLVAGACAGPMGESGSGSVPAASKPGSTGRVATSLEALPSWNEGPAKRSIVDFVARVTDPDGADFVPEAERIATFDNDGCLWAEQPMYFQLLFAVDRLRAMVDDHPEWRREQPFQALLEGDQEAIATFTEHDLVKIIMASHAGMTTDEFEEIVLDWISEARHPTTGRLFTAMVYQPMLELLDYLRGHGFKTFIVSGGGIEFIRPWAEEVYGIPPEQVVGSSIKTEFTMRDGEPVLLRLPEVNFIDDKAGKPVGIHSHIGRRPIAAFGNSDGDLQMLQYTAAGEGARLMVYIHHTDAEREWAYDRGSHIGGLDQGLDEAVERGWTVVSMKDDWNRIFPD